jgi:hypothetical protein
VKEELHIKTADSPSQPLSGQDGLHVNFAGGGGAARALIHSVLNPWHFDADTMGSRPEGAPDRRSVLVAEERDTDRQQEAALLSSA